MKVGYTRVSTQGQSLGRQQDLMTELGVEKVFEEKASGKDTDRPELQAMLAFVRETDVLVIESVSRLARSTRDLLNIVDQLKTKGVSLVSKKEAFDTSTPAGKFVLTLFAGLAELERDNILTRQREGIASALSRGVRFGRPKIQKPKEFSEVVARVRAGEISSIEGMKILGMRRSSYYKFFAECQPT